MATASEVLGGWLQHAIDNPKSTIQSILTSAMFVDAILLGCGCLSIKTTSIAAGVLTVCKVGLGMLQKDADVVLATVPGSSTPQTVPAHPVPDNPAAVPVASIKP